ncbi:MAG: methyltransferase domain-containing protein [Chloroflexota bacterium]|nr:methyltransferase domain-containing protein [Chloroflexota bacterium]
MQETRLIEDKAREIFGRRARMYVDSRAHTDPVVLNRLIALTQPQPDWRVLDVATGTGHTAFAFSPHVLEVVGIDITPQMLDLAEELALERAIANVRFRLANIHHLPFDDETFDGEGFDLVTCRRAAHHFRDIHEALSEMVRMLKPGGLLLIDDRSVPEDSYIDSIMNRLDWLHDESHVRQYRPSEWQAMLAKAGCQVQVVESYERIRPLSSLTADVSAENVAAIDELLKDMTVEEQQLIELTKKGEELYSKHWYVTVLGKKATS